MNATQTEPLVRTSSLCRCQCLAALIGDVNHKDECLDCGRLGAVLLKELKVRDASHDLGKHLCHGFLRRIWNSSRTELMA